MPLKEEIQKKEQYIYVGRLDKLKGIDILLEAWRDLPGKTLLICGSGPEEARVHSYLKENHMDKVKLLGQCMHKDVLRLLSESKALIMPTLWYEGQPMVIVESYAVNTPVIVSDIGNAGKMVETEGTGIRFRCGDAKALKEAIIQMEQESSWDTRSVYQEKYTAEKNYELLQEIYRKVQKGLECE